MEIMVAHHIPYCATANIAFPEDLIKKIKKAKEIQGMKFIHLYAPCPTGWKHSPDITIKIARLATQTNVFPIYEVENGIYQINKRIAKPQPVSEYLAIQGRFRHLDHKDVDFIQKEVDTNWKRLLKMEEVFGKTLE